MTILFSILTVIMMGPMGMYASQMGLKGVASLPGPYLSMGNLGFSKAICNSDYVGIDEPKAFGCRVGSITQLYSSGLIGTGPTNAGT